MSMSMTELEQALRALRLSGMIATLQARALQVAHHQMDFTEAFASLVQDELDRRRSRLLERRFTLSGLPERKDLKDFDWSYNPRIPKREVLELATLKFVEAREGALLLGPPGVGKSHVAKALAHLGVQRGYKVLSSVTQNSPRSVSQNSPASLSIRGTRDVGGEDKRGDHPATGRRRCGGGYGRARALGRDSPDVFR
jgi:DNA replication protein DnaC